MHGAFMSGLREAAFIVRATEDRLVSNPDLKRPFAKSSVSGDVLVKLFKEPDLAFGSFAFVFSEGSEDSKAMGLMRVSFQKPVMLPKLFVC